MTAPLTNWRLTVRDWDGAFRHERYASHLDPALQADVPASGLEAVQTGFGDCTELTFQAVWPSVRIKARDLIELDTQDTSGVWTRRWAGVTVKSGNAQVTWGHTNFKAAGLRLRLSEVRVPIDLPEGDVGAQARAALNAVLESGQLGRAVLLDPARLPDVAVQLGTVQARGRTLLDILDYLAAQGGQVLGVDEFRTVFWRPRATGTGDILALEETVADPQRAVVATFEDASAEALVTRVRWHAGRGDDGQPVIQEIRTPHEARYGVAVKDVPLDPATQIWLTVPYQIRVSNVSAPSAGQLRFLTDRQVGDGWYAGLLNAGQGGWVELVTLAPMQRAALSLEWQNVAPQRAAECQLVISIPGSVLDNVARGAYQSATQSATLVDAVVRSRSATQDVPPDLPTGTVLRVMIPPNATLLLREMRPEVIDVQGLTQAAEYHVVLPSRDPATVRVPWPVTPRPTLSLRRLLGDTYEAPVEVVRLMIKLGDPGVSIVQTGQREAAEVVAARYLAQRALDAATFTAIRAAEAEGAGT